MKVSRLYQRVLLVTDDKDVQKQVGPAFSNETDLIIETSYHEAVQKIKIHPFNVLIIDSEALLKGVDNENRIFELSQFATQKNNRLTIIIIVKKMLSLSGKTARRYGANLIMNKNEISINRLIYVVRALRKRSFRIIFCQELNLNESYSIDIYYYMPLNNRFCKFLPEGTLYTVEKKIKLKNSNILHLFVKADQLMETIEVIKKKQQLKTLRSERLARARKLYKFFMVDFFDVSSDGNIHVGKEIYSRGMEIVSILESIIADYNNLYYCISELPYSRWSELSEGINCAIFSLIFSGICKLDFASELAFASLIHNIGLSEIRQELIGKDRSSFSKNDLKNYQSHVLRSIDFIKRKQVPVSEFIEKTILHHHEHFDGTGFPENLAKEKIPPGAALLSIVSCYNRFKSSVPGERALSSADAWKKLKLYDRDGGKLNKKFHPELLLEIDNIFDLSCSAVHEDINNSA